MKPRTNTILPLVVIAGIALSASAGAATIVTNFKTNVDEIGHYTGGLASTIAFGLATASPFTFRYDITGLGLGAADHLLITVASTGGNLMNAGGHGIAVVGGNSDNFWDNSDGPLSFTVAIRNASNVDITISHTVDLTGASLRWGNGTPASTFSIAGSGPFSFVNTFQNFTLPTGQTNETAFTATRNNDTITQFAQLRFDIAAIPEPSAALLGGLGMLALVLRRRRA